MKLPPDLSGTEVARRLAPALIFEVAADDVDAGYSARALGLRLPR